MLAVLSDVVRNIVILIVLVTMLEMLLPRNDFRPFVNMVVGLVLMLMLLSPLRSLLQLPGALDPVLEMRMSIAEADVTKRQEMLEQMNWDLTLARYRDLVGAKINAVLAEEGLAVVSLELELEEDVAHLEFGVPRRVSIVAGESGKSGAVAPVEEIRIETGPGRAAPEPGAAMRQQAVEAKLASGLGISREKVEVYVLNR